jgi:hypothetical protein
VLPLPPAPVQVAAALALCLLLLRTSRRRQPAGVEVAEAPPTTDWGDLFSRPARRR